MHVSNVVCIFISQVYLLADDIQTLLVELETDFLTIFVDGNYNHSLKGELLPSRKSDKKLTKVQEVHMLLICTVFSLTCSNILSLLYDLILLYNYLKFEALRSCA